MTILCIETSTQVCSAAVVADGEVIAARSNIEGENLPKEGGNHAALLPVFVDELLQKMREQGRQPDAVAVSEGPGSYTGLRIGVSTAKGISYGLQVPLLAIPTLQIVAAAAKARYGGEIEEGAWLCPMLDARRMEIYTALYDTALVEKRAVEARVVESGDWLEETGKKVYYFGDGAAKCREVLQQQKWIYLEGIVPDARYMGELAEAKLAENPKGADVAYMEPFYLKEFVAAVSHVKGLQ